jgi:hypothetical protein
VPTKKKKDYRHISVVFQGFLCWRREKQQKHACLSQCLINSLTMAHDIAACDFGVVTFLRLLMKLSLHVTPVLLAVQKSMANRTKIVE